MPGTVNDRWALRPGPVGIRSRPWDLKKPAVAFAGAVPWPLRDSSFPLAASCSMNTPSAASE